MKMRRPCVTAHPRIPKTDDPSAASKTPSRPKSPSRPLHHPPVHSDPPRPATRFDEMDILNPIPAWKNPRRTHAKKQPVAAAIRNHVMLGWMRVKFSRLLPDG